MDEKPTIKQLLEKSTIKPDPESTVIGPDEKPIRAKYLTLGVEKFLRPSKHYRLIWLFGDQAWLAEENKTRFRSKARAEEAGRKLAEEKGARRFDERTR